MKLQILHALIQWKRPVLEITQNLETAPNAGRHYLNSRADCALVLYSVVESKSNGFNRNGTAVCGNVIWSTAERGGGEKSADVVVDRCQSADGERSLDMVRATVAGHSCVSAVATTRRLCCALFSHLDTG